MKPATFAPAYCAMYPMLVEIVRWHGYALAVHGTVQRDFDLVAIPWGIDPSPPDAVVRELVGRLDVRLIGSFEPKMHGRVACTLSVGFGECAIDLSFMPCVPVRDNLTRATPPRAEVDVEAVRRAALEEAARECERLRDEPICDSADLVIKGRMDYDEVATELAEAIRALSSPTPTDAREAGGNDAT